MMKHEIIILILTVANLFNLYMIFSGWLYSIIPFIICCVATGLNFDMIRKKNKIKNLTKG